MPASTDRTLINSARDVFNNQRSALVDKLFEAEDAASALLEARRQFATGTDELVAAEQRKQAADTALSQARIDEKSDRAGLQSTLNDWLNGVSADDDVGRLETTAPIVLLPVRLETRFDGNVLQVRVYPDEISLNKHERALTKDEEAAGKKYYRDFADLGNERDRWREIVGRFGSQRAAYIVRALLPTALKDSTCPHPLSRARLQAGFSFFPFQSRAGAWTRPGEAVLPDRWVLVTYRKGVRTIRLPGRPISEPLAITVDPGLPADQQAEIANNTYKIDENILWTVDFNKAKDVGMAFEIPLSPEEAAVRTGGFDRLIVLGVKSSMSAEDTAELIEELLDAHHYTRGLSIVQQGTPTNNTEDSPTPYPPKDEAGAHSFQVERQLAPSHPTRSYQQAGCPAADTDGYALTRLLGVPSSMAENIERGLEHEIDHARTMNQVLWPLTYGYFLKFLMDPVFSDPTIAKTKSYFRDYVRARGPAPAFRVGGVPYGVLPITSLSRWQERALGTADEKSVEAALLDPLRMRLLPIWLDASAAAPRIGTTPSNPDIDLSRVLSTYASSKQVRIRSGIGKVTAYDTFNFFGIDFFGAVQRFEELAQRLFRRVGFPNWRPRIAGVQFNEQAWNFTGPFVAETVSEDKPLEPVASNFIQGILDATIPELRDGQVSGKPSGSNLLYSLLRHSTLVEYMRLANDLRSQLEKWLEPELFGFPSIPVITSIMSTMANLDSQVRASAIEYRTTLGKLINVPTAELERLLTETLDLASHRLDAWVTAFATRRIAKMRDAQEAAHHQPWIPFRSFLGGYAWLENVRPVARQVETRPGVGSVEIQPDNGGFIHAPSMTHAAAAAILRNGHMALRKEDPSKYAVDLSSRRVRAARRVLDEVRAGQPLGAVLGYHFERGLHEGHPGVADLDKYRFALRGLFPLVAGKNGVDTTEPAETIAARNVVDGLALLRANRTPGGIDFAHDPKLPRPGTAAYNAIQSELRTLDDQLDAVADLTTAESVFQLARGNITGASASLDNLAVGGRPPDPAVAKSPRSSVGVSHRVALVFPDSLDSTLPSPWPDATPRALAEPVLDAYVGRLIGDPSKVTCRVTFDEAPGSAVVQLSQLALRPLDVVALARAIDQAGLGSVLDERVLRAALGASVKTNVAIDYAPAASRNIDEDRTFPEVLELARALGAVLSGTRPLLPGDLLPPAELDAGLEDSEPTNLSGGDELIGRAKDALAALDQVTNGADASEGLSLALALQVADPEQPTPSETELLRATLTAAAGFAPERAFPPQAASGAELFQTATAVQLELRRRLAAAPDLTPDAVINFTAKERVDAGTAALKATFGNDFFALPRVDLPNGSELRLSLAARSTLLGSDDGAPDFYLQQAMRTRASLGRFRKFSLYARALGASQPTTHVMQLPFVPGEKWLGLPFDMAPEQGRSVLLFLSEASSLDTLVSWRGIVLEQWTEVIAKKKQVTAISFHYDTPRSSAPQAVLVAAPASTGDTWQFQDLLSALEETLNLAKVRGVDAELLPLGQLFPAMVLAQNDANDITPKTSLAEDIAAAAVEAAQGFL